MCKNSIIAALAALLAVRSTPCFAACGLHIQAAIATGLFIPVLFFCLFCDICAEKWQAHARGEKGLEEYIRKLR